MFRLFVCNFVATPFVNLLKASKIHRLRSAIDFLVAFDQLPADLAKRLTKSAGAAADSAFSANL
jgi:hypothetical protein